MNFLKLFYFSSDLRFEINSSYAKVLESFSRLLRIDRNTSGDVKGNEFAFMNINTLPEIRLMSLVIFSGHIEGDDNYSQMKIKGRLSKPVIYIFLVAGISIPILYLFNVGKFHDEFSSAPLFMNPLFAPLWVYLFLVFSYWMKIIDVNNIMIGFKRKMEQLTNSQ